MNQKGFAPILAVLAVLTILVTGATIYYKNPDLFSKKPLPQTSTEKEGKIVRNIWGYLLQIPEGIKAEYEGYIKSGSETEYTPENAQDLLILPDDKENSTERPFMRISVGGEINKTLPLMDYINHDYQKNVKNPNTLVRIVEDLHQSTFNGVPAYEYTLESKGFTSNGLSSFASQGRVKIVAFERNGRFWTIGYYDTPKFNQVLSTFKFTDQKETSDTSGWQIYKDTYGKYTIKIPPNWKITPSVKSQYYSSYAIFEYGNLAKIDLSKTSEMGLSPREVFLKGHTENDYTELINSANQYQAVVPVYADAIPGTKGIVSIIKENETSYYSAFLHTYKEGPMNYIDIFNKILSTFKFTQ